MMAFLYHFYKEELAQLASTLKINLEQWTEDSQCLLMTSQTNDKRDCIKLRETVEEWLGSMHYQKRILCQAAEWALYKPLMQAYLPSFFREHPSIFIISTSTFVVSNLLPVYILGKDKKAVDAAAYQFTRDMLLQRKAVIPKEPSPPPFFIMPNKPNITVKVTNQRS